MAKNEVAKIEDVYPVLSGKLSKEIAEISKENIGGERPSLFDLERIKIVPGGVPGLQIVDPATQESEIKKEIVGVIIGKMSGRSYWESDEADGPPDCSATEDGVGTQHGNCETCEFNQWGSDPKGGDGKACKEFRALLILRGDVEGGAFLPSLLMVPPASLRRFTGYMFGLTNRRLLFRDVETKISTEKASSRGNDYSKLVFSLVRPLGLKREAVQDYASPFLESGFPSPGSQGESNGRAETIVD
jgi:hypothetical protein